VTNPVSRHRNSSVCPRRLWRLRTFGGTALMPLCSPDGCSCMPSGYLPMAALISTAAMDVEYSKIQHYSALLCEGSLASQSSLLIAGALPQLAGLLEVLVRVVIPFSCYILLILHRLSAWVLKITCFFKDFVCLIASLPDFAGDGAFLRIQHYA